MQRRRFKRRDQRGLTLIETTVACLIMMFLTLFMAQLFGVVVVLNKNNGSDATKAVTLAEAKLEELTGLAFTDTTSDTTQAGPPYPTDTGSGLTAGGSITVRTEDFCDFVDPNGVKLPVPNDLTQTPTAAAFVRQWQIIDDSTTLKRIIVAVTSVRSFQYGAPPATTLVTLKTQ